MRPYKISRRQFVKTSALGIGVGLGLSCAKKQNAPNLVYIFADQWRARDTGYAGNTDVKTPHLDKLAKESINFTTAVSGCPVSSPYRASLLTGQYWLTHGIFYNDKPLNPNLVSIADVYKKEGYNTAYIGKWHLNGHEKGQTMREGRDAPIPKDRRQGFEFWKVRECTHDYNNSFYYDEDNVKHYWDGYDAIAQTKEAQQYIKDHSKGNPFILFLSWGPPHAPYHTAPEKYKKMFDPEKIKLLPNVPSQLEEKAREDYAGYYAHMAALDDCMGEILQTLRDTNLEENTILVFTSDHGDMLYSHGMKKKQKPWDESIRVPFLLRYPQLHGRQGKEIDMPINTPDIMPTLLGLSQISIPESVEGKDFSGVIRGTTQPMNEAAKLTCPVPFHQWSYGKGGREYRGVRTRRYTYCRDLNGPWLLYDNQNDPYQLKNLVDHQDYKSVQEHLESLLQQKLTETNDQFLSGPQYMKKWNYFWDGSDSLKT